MFAVCTFSSALLLCCCCLGIAWAADETNSAAAASDSQLLSPVGYAQKVEGYFAARASSGLLENDAISLTRLHLQVLQQALDRWAIDHAEVTEHGVLRKYYPASISQLVHGGYVSPGIYANAYTAAGPEQLNAVEVPLGWTPQSPGNFSYLAELKNASLATSYILLGYGDSQQKDWDRGIDPLMNGVCCDLSSQGRMGGFGLGNTAMWQGGRSYNIGLMFGSADNATAEFFYNKRQGRLDSAAALDLAKQELYALQLALERFSVDYSPPDVEGKDWREQERRYPEAISALVQETYTLAGFYANPFSASSPVELNAREVPFGWTEDSPGNFSYLKHYSPAGNVDGYVLVLYGDKPDAGHDIDGDGKADGTALVLSSMFNLPAGTVPVYSGSQRVGYQWSLPQD